MPTHAPPEPEAASYIFKRPIAEPQLGNRKHGQVRRGDLEERDNDPEERGRNGYHDPNRGHQVGVERDISLIEGGA